ncbi:hypothetical protein Tco_1214773 [Tanacetum coccineum]
MADENVPPPAPTRSNDHIILFAAWVPIGKSNFFFDLQKKQRNLIFQISDTPLCLRLDWSLPVFQLDEDWFILDANLLREALDITPVDQAYKFLMPPSGDAIMDFVNQLGYLGEIHFVSRMTMNNLYQPWRAILSMINQYFVQAMQTFLADKANRSIAPHKGKKTKPHFIPKGEEDEVFQMQIPKELIMNNIRNAPYYNAYMEKVTKHDKKITAEKGGKKKSASKADQSKKPTTAKQPKPMPSK